MALVASPLKTVLPLRARMKALRSEQSLNLQEIKEGLQEVCDGEFDAAADYDTTPENIKYFKARFPKDPLSPVFLEEVLAPFIASNQVNAIVLLAKMGRREIETFALELMKQKDQTVRFESAQALAFLSNSKGFEEIEKMARERLKQPDSEDAIPYDWFTSFLQDELAGDPVAVALYERLMALKTGQHS